MTTIMPSSTRAFLILLLFLDAPGWMDGWMDGWMRIMIEYHPAEISLRVVLMPSYNVRQRVS